MSANATHFDVRKWLLRFGLLVLAVPVFLVIFVILPGAEHLLLGWLYFPLRTLAAGTAMVGATHQFVCPPSGRATKSAAPREPVISMIGAGRSAAQQQM